jgi:divalent metal cation (Fe/Co/Zn/Cd) transporter
MGHHDILVNIDVEFADDLSTDEVEETIDQIESSVREAIPDATKIYIEAQAIKRKYAKGTTGEGTSEKP